MQLKKRRAFRRFIRGCKLFIEIRGPPLSEAELYEAVMHFLATNQRKAFEALKGQMKRRQQQWNDTVKWYNWVCMPRAMAKWKSAFELAKRCVCTVAVIACCLIPRYSAFGLSQ